ncbi:putative membrane transport protein [Helianthus debilis subsp. tardiflorus]
MGFVDLFSAASMPVLKVLIVTALGSFLALDSVDILGQRTRKQVNDIVFFVFSPSLVGSNLAKTITLESIISMWFMPVNILLTYIVGSALGWLLLIITKPPQHLKGLILGTCAAGKLPVPVKHKKEILKPLLLIKGFSIVFVIKRYVTFAVQKKDIFFFFVARRS